jgi:hypothetical protein
MIWFSWRTFRIEEVHAGPVVISVIAIGANVMLNAFFGPGHALVFELGEQWGLTTGLISGWSSGNL